MEYRYPKIRSTLLYKRTDPDTVEVTDYLADTHYVMDIRAVRYIRQLDGFAHPYDIESELTKKERATVIRFLDKNGLSTESDVTRVSFGTRLKTLWIPKHTPFLKWLARITNSLLMLAWLPMLIGGIVMFAKHASHIGLDGYFLGYLVGLLSGVLLHELGHAFAGIAYGAHVFEMGVMVMYCVLPGAYVLVDELPVKKRLQRIQINAAGVEMNFLLCGLFLLLATAFAPLASMFFSAAFCNAFLGFLNLTLIKGLDGTQIVGELFGVKQLVERAKSVALKKETRKKVLGQGINGYATVAMCYMVFALQLVLPVLLIVNVLEVIACFL